MSTDEHGPVAGAAPAFWTLTADETASNEDTAYSPLPVDLRAEVTS